MPQKSIGRFGKTSELGKSGLEQWQGYIEEDFIRELRGKDAYKRYNEMRLNSSVAGGMLTAIELSIRGIDWNFTSEDENDPRLEILNESLNNMAHSWNDHISEALTMLPFGFVLFEIVYKREGPRIVWRKFAPRGQDTVYRWLFDDAGGLQGFIQQASPTYEPIEIPIEKLVLYRTKVEKNNPEGRSIFRTAWKDYYYQKNIMMIEGIGIERDLAGMPVVKLPEIASVGEASSTDEARAETMVRNIRRDEQEGVIVPSGWEVELLSTGGTRQFDTNAIIRRYESRILLSMLAQFLLLGQDKVGTQALSKDQSDFFVMGVNSIADTFAETFLKYPIPRLLKLNGYDSEGIGFEHTPAGDIDIIAVADFLQKVGAKVSWTPEDEIWLRGVAKLPDIDEDTIVEERERRQESALAFARRGGFDGQDNSKMGIEYFEGEAPDDNLRRKMERAYTVVNNRFFKGQKKRVEKEAQKVKRGLQS